MRVLLPLSLVLACCVLFGSCADSTCANSCCANSTCPASCQSCVVPGNCRNPLLRPISFDPALSSPLYQHIRTLDDSCPKTDNCCLTYFRMAYMTYLIFQSCVSENGTNYIDSYIFGPAPGCPGVFRRQGVSLGYSDNGCNSCVYNSYTLGEACYGTIVEYWCYFAGDCDGIDRDSEIRVGLSTYRDLSECCKDRLIALANEQTDVFYLSRNFYKFAGVLDRKCVKYFNGAMCINGDTIRPEDAISLPANQTNCQ